MRRMRNEANKANCGRVNLRLFGNLESKQGLSYEAPKVFRPSGASGEISSQVIPIIAS